MSNQEWVTSESLSRSIRIKSAPAYRWGNLVSHGVPKEPTSKSYTFPKATKWERFMCILKDKIAVGCLWVVDKLGRGYMYQDPYWVEDE